MIARTFDKTPAFSEADLVASICRESFYSFVQEMWHAVIDEKPVWNWHIEYLCNEMQIVAERVFAGEPKEYDLVINIPPGTSKSTICSVMFPAWCWTRKPATRCICASYSHSLALDLSRKCRDVVMSTTIGDEVRARPGYSTCFPGVVLRDDQNTKAYFANTQKGIRFCVGTGGSVTGMHGHFLIVDDPLNPLESASEAELKACNRWMSETLPSRKVDKRVVPTILIQQRLHEADPSGERLALKDSPVKHINLPAEIEDGPKPTYLARFYTQGLLDPVRMPRHVLRQEEVALGAYGYSCQFRQRAVPRGGGMFKIARFLRGKAPRGSGFWKRLVRYWDKAGTKGAGAYTVGALLGVDKDDRLWVVDIRRGQWESAERESTIKRTAREDAHLYGERNVTVVIEQEPGSGGKDSARDTVRRLRGYRVRLDRPTGDKVHRADVFSTQVNEGNVWLNEGDWNREYLNELEYFPSSKYKDQTDASSGACNQLVMVRVVGGRRTRGTVHGQPV